MEAMTPTRPDHNEAAKTIERHESATRLVEALAYADGLLMELGERLGALEDRLTPVLYLESPTVAAPGQDTPLRATQAPAIEQVEQLHTAVARIMRRVENLHGRVQL